MRGKIGIIGLGWVGSSVAISLLQAGVASELYLNDIQSDLAEGEAMDLAHGSSFYPSCKIKSATIKDMHHCDAIVVAAGKGGTEGQSRLELVKFNADIIREIALQCKGFQGLIVMVTNPVDVLAYAFAHYAKIPFERVIGTGTMLDTARLRQVLGEHLHLNPRSIEAQVLGEHGDSQVAIWSQARIAGIPLRSWPEWNQHNEEKIEHQVRFAAREIIKRKGATNHAIGLVTAFLMKWALRDDRRIMTVSSGMHGVFNTDTTCISLPCLLGRNGLELILSPDMNESEKAKLEHSASIIQKEILSLSL